MPSTSKKQHNFMEAVANNPAFAKKAGVPQSVGKEFAEADKGKKFGSGGAETRADRQAINQPKTNHGAEALFKKGGRMATKMGKPVMKPGMDMAKDGMKKPTPMAKTAMPGSMMGMKKGGATKRMNSGGSPVPVQHLPYMGPKKESPPKPIHPAGLGSGTNTTPKAKSMDEYKRGGGVKKMAAGGLSAGHKSANGIATKGKTKGTQISMAGNQGLKKGGMAKKYC
jgi:hypothetical protein